MASKNPNRRDFLKRGAAVTGSLALGGAGAMTLRDARPADGQVAESAAAGPQDWESPELIAYGQRSYRETSHRMAHGGRPSPDEFGLAFHVANPLQESVGVITPSSLHHVATTRGAIVPDIDPREHRLLIHGLVDRELIFTMEDLKRLPSVTRLHFIECAGNRSNRNMRTVQETHGLCSCAEWTGVPLSLLLREAGVKTAGTWLVTEGVENVMGGSTIPMAKALDDCVVAYGMNGEMVRPQHGYPLRLMVPGFEGIFHTKWLRRIKVVDRYYLTYNDFGHLSQDPIEAALGYQIGPKSVITHPSGSMQLPDRNFYEIRGLAWSGHGAISRVEVSTDGGRTWADAQFQGTPQKMAHTRFTFPWRWDGNETEIMSRATDEIGQIQPTRAQAATFGREGSVYPNAPGQQPRVRGMDNSIQPWRIARDGSVTNAIA